MISSGYKSLILMLAVGAITNVANACLQKIYLNFH